MATRIGIDVGGTFTDLILLDEESGEIIVGKGPSDPAAVDQAVVESSRPPWTAPPSSGPLLPARHDGGSQRVART